LYIKSKSEINKKTRLNAPKQVIYIEFCTDANITLIKMTIKLIQIKYKERTV